MELDPFLALEHTPSTPPSSYPAAAIASDLGDPVASLLGEENYDGSSVPVAAAAATTVVINRSSEEEEEDHSAAVPVSKKHYSASNNAGSSSNLEPGSQAFSFNNRLFCELSSWINQLIINHIQNRHDDREMTTHKQDLNEQLANLLINKQLPQSIVTSLQSTLRENATLKEKNAKLKSLLGRSAKAQRDAKHELEHMKKQFEELRGENERLERRVEQLANRPTHMDLLADFETNFDRALLSIGNHNNDQNGRQQSGGEDAAEQSYADDTIVDGYYDELTPPSSVSRTARNTQLESLQQSLQNRNGHLERTHRSLQSELQSTKNTLANLNLELRMSKMETEHALRTLREKEATMAEMQLEIDLVARSAAEANKRAVEGIEAVRSVKIDREYVEGLEAKVAALQEWALASTESKRLTGERCHGLEERVKELEEMVALLATGEDGSKLAMDETGGAAALNNEVTSAAHTTTMRTASSSVVFDDSTSAPARERKLWTKSSSLVVGAGMVGHAFLELGSQQELDIQPYETVILRWKFDLTPAELDIYFSVLKGICGDKKSQRAADSCFRNRHVQGGGGGEVSGAFAVQNACTLLFSNEMSWVRPRTIKWTVDAVAIEWSD
ncbi:hypothetical protein HJC23_004675 [Cyclotella cryptica]|uniref:Uncharacterized protein n=1 Tax=Cyclotella cryptica TaxID=29204 RepID=A0ABD3PKJ6_9STRA